MKKINKRVKMFILVMMMSLAVPMLVYSQPPPPDGDDVDTPFDGGISLVLAVGGILGVKKVRGKNTK